MFELKTAVLFPLLAAALVACAQPALAEQLTLSTSSSVYSKGEILFVYGTGMPDEALILRMTAPDETIIKFDQIKADGDGVFHYPLLAWPEESTDFPLGTYAIEVISTGQGISRTADVKFSSTSDLVEVPIERNLDILVFAPESAAVNSPLRVFVQLTSDGLLLGNSPDQLLQSTHVHTPVGGLEPLSDSFSTLHRGLYFVDYTPAQEGTYVFHVVAFSQGTASHGSVATSVIGQDLGGISDQIIRLNTILDETSAELATLKSEIGGFGSTLHTASDDIRSGVSSVSRSVENMEDASSQLNSLLLPIVSSIGIIVALQIVILARRRVM